MIVNSCRHCIFIPMIFPQIPVYMTLHIVERNILGNVFCSIIAFIDNTLVIVSMWTLVLTSLDRSVDSSRYC